MTPSSILTLLSIQSGSSRTAQGAHVTRGSCEYILHAVQNQSVSCVFVIVVVDDTSVTLYYSFLLFECRSRTFVYTYVWCYRNVVIYGLRALPRTQLSRGVSLMLGYVSLATCASVPDYRSLMKQFGFRWYSTEKKWKCQY